MDDMGLFINTSATATITSASLDAPYLIAWAFGAQTNTPSLIQWEYSVNYEGQFDSQNFLSGGINTNSAATDAEPGWYESAINAIRNIDPLEPLYGFTSSTANSMASTVASNLGNTLGTIMGNGVVYPRTNARTFRIAR